MRKMFCNPVWSKITSIPLKQQEMSQCGDSQCCLYELIAAVGNSLWDSIWFLELGWKDALEKLVQGTLPITLSEEPMSLNITYRTLRGNERSSGDWLGLYVGGMSER